MTIAALRAYESLRESLRSQLVANLDALAENGGKVWAIEAGLCRTDAVAIGRLVAAGAALVTAYRTNILVSRDDKQPASSDYYQVRVTLAISKQSNKRGLIL